MNWDDLRIAMAVHKCGSYAKAGALLRVDETTVARRLTRLQRDLGVTLFEAVDGERKPTPQCEEILRHVDQITRHVDQIAALRSADEDPVGHYRIAATNSVSVGVLAPKAPRFLQRQPGLTLHFLTSTENVNFSRWEADLAIRLRKPDKGDFAISKLGEIGLCLIEPKDTANRNEEEIVCAFPEDLDLTPESQFMIATGRHPRARCVTKNFLVIQTLVRSGACSAVLPDFLCAEFLDRDDLSTTKLDESREAWLLVQHHLKHDPGTRAVIDWMRDCFVELRH